MFVSTPPFCAGGPALQLPLTRKPAQPLGQLLQPLRSNYSPAAAV